MTQSNQYRSTFSIRAIIKHAEIVNTGSGKQNVLLYLTEQRGGAENKKYVDYSCRLVGDKATDFITLMNNGKVPFGKQSPSFTKFSSDQVDISTTPVQAQVLKYENGQNMLVGNPFNSYVTNFIAYDFSIERISRKQGNQPMQQQAPQQQAPQQQAPQQQAPQQQAPQQQASSFDDFDDDIPF